MAMALASPAAMSSVNVDIADFMEEVKIKLRELCC